MDHEDLGQRILITTWALVGLSGLFLTVRLICKLKTKRHLWWDDHVLTLSWVSIAEATGLAQLTLLLTSM